MGKPLRSTGRQKVASRAEAWIETVGGSLLETAFQVASRAEAWIETRGYLLLMP